jgi:hypothetical protein
VSKPVVTALEPEPAPAERGNLIPRQRAGEARRRAPASFDHHPREEAFNVPGDRALIFFAG